MNTAIPRLHDIHLPPSPGWWPPAPGWWLVAFAVLLALTWSARRLLRWQRDRQRIASALRDFDRALAASNATTEKLAVASLLLRRGAKACDPGAAALEGDAWLRYLDGDDPAQPFTNGSGQLLRDGGFRRAMVEDIAPTIAIARARFLCLLERAHA